MNTEAKRWELSPITHEGLWEQNHDLIDKVIIKFKKNNNSILLSC